MSVSRALRLLRFIEKDKGPILSIASTPYPSFFRRHLWHSTAELHPDLFLGNAKLAVMRYCGGGWSSDKEESQRKAVTEAVERWAFFDYSRNSPGQAGIDMDASSNGFAAIPSEMGPEPAIINAYCEALERWILNRIWDFGDVALERQALKNKSLIQMIKPLSPHISCYSLDISPEKVVESMSSPIIFSLCLLKTGVGGAISGAACSSSPEIALERASLEAYLHAVTYSRMVKARLTSFENIIEKRLFHFAGLSEGHAAVMERLKVSCKPAPMKSPGILFSKTLPGPWEPEIVVHRVLLNGSRPILDGGVDRFFI